MKPYPLTFDPILKSKVWGGRRLERLGKSLPPGEMVGESWELADLSSTSADGGGGGAARSVIASGEMRGLTIADAVTAAGHNLMGSLRKTGDGGSAGSVGGFPLLVKFLDARENLSVQVHPSPAYAAAHGGEGVALKTETWYVVDAEPGAVIYKGINQGVTRERFERDLRAGADITGHLISVPVKPGDVHHLPSGTCHALGAGVMVAEVQTPSDTTFRVFDWGRTGRPLHVEPALSCMHFGPPPRLGAVRGDGGPRCRLVETDAYHLFELSLMGGTEREVENVPAFPTGGPMVWIVLRGEGRIVSHDGAYRPVEWRTGTTILFPAALGPSRCEVARDASVIEVRFPSSRS